MSKQSDLVNLSSGDTSVFKTSDTERMRIDSSGNVMVGTTDVAPGAGNTNTGTSFNSGRVFSSASSNYAAALNRNTSDGDMVRFYKNGQIVGNIGNTFGQGYGLDIDGISGYVGINTDDNGNGGGIKFFGRTYSSTPRMFPVTDNFVDLGHVSARWNEVFATNGTIQTSDRNEKQDIEVLSDAEQRVAVAAKGLLRKYRWKDMVAEKGDAARIHFGIIAQDLQAAFAAEGLDAGRYSMFISSTWWEAEVEKTREVEQEDGTTITETYTVTETYDEATEGATERTRLGVRYPELLAFIIAAL